MKIGLLPLYISLYGPKLRERLEPFYEKIASIFEEKGLEVIRSEFCMEDEHFEKAISTYEKENCDAIVTIHMAYSPSLKSEKVLAKTKLPIIICDTTETFDFSDGQSPSEISYCHGIHGVMDMCNLLKKNKKAYAIAAGHFEESNVIDRVIGFVKAAKCAKSLLGSNVGSIGGYFEGMGDFRVDDERLKKLYDVNVIYPEKGELTQISQEVTEDEIKIEKARNEKDFDFVEEFDEVLYTNSVITDLTLKKWIEKRSLNAFTVNFRELGNLSTMPFNGACRAMADGIGYAGEGDTLTALFTGALMSEYKETSFVEIFCPDWKNDTLFISHMGEMNYNLAAKKPEFFEKKFIYGKGINPISGAACYKSGEAIFMNIFEDENGFNAFLAPVSVVEEKTDKFKKRIRGWLDFKKTVSEVLETLSKCGATHHSILVYNTNVDEMTYFAKLLNISPVKL